MTGIWLLLLLILAAALPAILVFFWLRTKKSAVTLPWFLISVAGGILSILAAALFQQLIPPRDDGFWQLFFDVFFRIALTEEVSRLFILIPLYIIGSAHKNSTAFGAALGLAAGMGFAMIENAFHGITDINITLLRAFTAAPLHGACGLKVGFAVFTFGKNKRKAISHFLSAVFIHGAYNMIILNPALPSALAILIAFIALFNSLQLTKNPDGNNENTYNSTGHLT